MRATLRTLFRSTLAASEQRQPPQPSVALSMANLFGSSASSSSASGSRQSGRGNSSGSPPPPPVSAGNGPLRQPPTSAMAPETTNPRGPKRFAKSQYYSPRTLSFPTLSAPPTRRAPPLLGPSRSEAIKTDPIHRLGLRPSKPSLRDDSYKNPVLLSQFVSEMGRIKSRSLTGLTRRSQREVGKAVRRARAMGLLPTMSNKSTMFIAWHSAEGRSEGR